MYGDLIDKRKFYVEVQEGAACNFRPATAEEIKEALLAEQERNTLVTQREAINKRLLELHNTESKVFYDIGCSPFDFRVFIASDRVVLI